jgi:hypothetical protein
MWGLYALIDQQQQIGESFKTQLQILRVALLGTFRHKAQRIIHGKV